MNNYSLIGEGMYSIKYGITFEMPSENSYKEQTTPIYSQKKVVSTKRIRDGYEKIQKFFLQNDVAYSHCILVPILRKEKEPIAFMLMLASALNIVP